MPEIYKFPCQECGGSGYITDRVLPIDDLDTEPSDCPTCHKGKMMLVVKCEESEGGGCRFAEDGTCSCKDGYRPLKVDEVEEIFSMHDMFNSKSTLSREQIMRLLIISIENGMAKYKGQSVKLKPAEGV
jgi:hypothetical protein